MNTSSHLPILTSHLTLKILIHTLHSPLDFICWVQSVSTTSHLSFLHMMSHRSPVLFCTGGETFSSAEVKEAATRDTGV